MALPGVPSHVAVGDFNRDGNLDVVATIPTSNAVAVLLGNGNGTFNAAISYPAGFTPNFVTVGDVNNDGIPDLVVASGADVSILLGNGDGSFQPAESFGANGLAETVAIGDFNGDGAPDLAVAGGQVSILLQVGAGPTPAANIAPSLVSFGNQGTGFTSTARTVTLTNGGAAALSIASISLTGAQAGDFSQTNTCGASIAAGGSCTFSITFTPSVLGNRMASIVITDNAFASPQIISLNGSGVAAAPDFSLAEASGSNCPPDGNCSTVSVITAGQTATYNLQVTPVNGFNGSVVLTCSGAPAPSTCVVSPPLVPPNGSSSYAFTVTINNTSSAMTLPQVDPLSQPPWLAARLISPLLLTFGIVLILVDLMLAQGRRRNLLMPPVLAVLLLSFLYASGCGAGSTSPTVRPPTNATVTITGTSNGANRTLPLSITINH